MDKATYGLIGVALGFLLTFIKDWWQSRKKNKKDAEYLCIHVTCMLERFISGCAAVVFDDGLCCGQPDRDGYSRPQVTPPDFTPENLEVEWKSLPVKLMYEVLNLPIDVEKANSKISGAFEHASPPDYDEGFEERQYQYSELALKALKLTTDLRKFSGLPNRVVEEWDPMVYVKKKKLEIESLREQRHKEFTKAINAQNASELSANDHA